MTAVERVNEERCFDAAVNRHIWQQSIHHTSPDSLWSMEVVPVTSGVHLLYGGLQALLCARAVQGLPGTTYLGCIESQHDVDR